MQYGTGLVEGGWDAVANIIANIGVGSETVNGPLFSAPQRQTVISETVEAAGGAGQTFRPTIQENQSMVESKKWSLFGWLGSPYQEELSVGYKSAESQQLAEKMGPKSDPFGESLDWALAQTRKVTTLYDQLSGLWKPREVITEKPRAGYPEGRDVQHLNETIDKGAEVIKAGKAWLGGAYDQVKGLFNSAFGQTGKQPVFSIEHELEPTVKIGIGVMAAVIILILLLRK